MKECELIKGGPTFWFLAVRFYRKLSEKCQLFKKITSPPGLRRRRNLTTVTTQSLVSSVAEATVLPFFIYIYFLPFW